MLFNQRAQSLVCVIAPLIRRWNWRLDHIPCWRIRRIPIQYFQTFLSSRFQRFRARNQCSSLWIIIQNSLRHPIFRSVSASAIQIVFDVYIYRNLLIAQPVYPLLLLCLERLARLWEVFKTLISLVYLCSDRILEFLDPSLIFIQDIRRLLLASIQIAGIIIAHLLFPFLGFASSHLLLRLRSRSIL